MCEQNGRGNAVTLATVGEQRDRVGDGYGHAAQCTLPHRQNVRDVPTRPKSKSAVAQQSVRPPPHDRAPGTAVLSACGASATLPSNGRGVGRQEGHTPQLTGRPASFGLHLRAGYPTAASTCPPHNLPAQRGRERGGTTPPQKRTAWQTAGCRSRGKAATTDERDGGVATWATPDAAAGSSETPTLGG